MQAHEEMRGVTACFSKAGLAEGTNDTTIKTAAPNGAGIDYSIDGIGYHLADGDNIAVTALAIQAELTTCLYLVQVNASGTASIKKGEAVLTADLTNGNAVLQWPTPDADNCPIGGYKIACASGYTFTSGTTDNGATGITDVYYDFVGGMPSAPLQS